MIEFIKKNWLRILLGTYLLFLLLVYIWNVLHYSTYWAYDGGSHIDYIDSILFSKTLPNSAKSYLSWHEPLYYLIQAVVAKVVMLFTDNRNLVLEILEMGSAFLIWFFVILSASLSWLVSKKKSITFLVTICVSGLFVVSELGRYVTNESLFQVLILVWLNLFYQWKMYDKKNWNLFRWISLIGLLAIILWTKLTGIVLLLALCLWLVIYAFQIKDKKVVLLSFIIFFLSLFLYSPWLVYKKVVFDNVLTINNYEVQSSERMDKKFFINWDISIMRDPFWSSGKKSFLSMFIVSSLVDYDNIFQNYYNLSDKKIQTDNTRYINYNRWVESLVYFWWSIPLVFISIFGLIIFIWNVVKDNFIDKRFFLFILLFGLFSSLVYNVYRYPFVERGTLKSLFILVFFPILFLLGFEELSKIKLKKISYILFIAYMIFWLVFSFLNIISTGPLVIGLPIY